MSNGNIATILDANNEIYFGKIVNIYGVILKKRKISKSEINKVIYKRRIKMVR